MPAPSQDIVVARIPVEVDDSAVEEFKRKFDEWIKELPEKLREAMRPPTIDQQGGGTQSVERSEEDSPTIRKLDEILGALRVIEQTLIGIAQTQTWGA